MSPNPRNAHTWNVDVMIKYMIYFRKTAPYHLKLSQ